MGYRRDLVATGYKPTADEEEIHRRFSGVVGRRELLVKPLEAYFGHRGSPQHSPVAPSDPPMSQFMGTINVMVTGFSDSIFLESSLAGSPNNALVPLNTIIAASIVAMFVNMKEESPIRGGVEIGFGVRSGGHIYSAATVSAVKLEKCAKYPRVLLGCNVIGTLDSIVAAGESDESRVARTIQGLFYADPDDGRIGLDFMGEVSKRFYASGFSPDDVWGIWRFAQRSRNYFGASGMEKEWRYYDRLIKYMEPRLALWGVDQYRP